MEESYMGKKSNSSPGSWELTPDKCLNEIEVGQMLRKASDLWTLGEVKQRKALVRDAMLIYTAIFTGLRNAEICDLLVTDLHIGNGEAHLVVRNGKGGKQRIVHLGKDFKVILKRYLQWKLDNQELEAGSYLLRTERSQRYCPSALWRRWKKYCPSHRLHDARHTNATMLYKASGNNLRLVQKQLGHSRITTTQVYADVMPDEARASMSAMEQMAGKSGKRSSRSVLAFTRGVSAGDRTDNDDGSDGND
jgi:integrase